MPGDTQGSVEPDWTAAAAEASGAPTAPPVGEWAPPPRLSHFPSAGSGGRFSLYKVTTGSSALKQVDPFKQNREYSYVWDITRSAASPYRLYHIEEEPGAIDWRDAVEVPTEEYYDALRRDMAERHPKASPYVLDHILSLEASWAWQS